jgi:hypothetical protein
MLKSHDAKVSPVLSFAASSSVADGLPPEIATVDPDAVKNYSELAAQRDLGRRTRAGRPQV